MVGFRRNRAQQAELAQAVYSGSAVDLAERVCHQGQALADGRLNYRMIVSGGNRCLVLTLNDVRSVGNDVIYDQFVLLRQSKKFKTVTLSVEGEQSKRAASDRMTSAVSSNAYNDLHLPRTQKVMQSFSTTSQCENWLCDQGRDVSKLKIEVIVR